MAQLQETLKEACGDLADQEDVIAGVLAQRDAFQVKFGASNLFYNSRLVGSTSQCSAIFDHTWVFLFMSVHSIETAIGSKFADEGEGDWVHSLDDDNSSTDFSSSNPS